MMNGTFMEGIRPTETGLRPRYFFAGSAIVQKSLVFGGVLSVLFVFLIPGRVAGMDRELVGEKWSRMRSLPVEFGGSA